jgi:hypothetical protein
VEVWPHWFWRYFSHALWRIVITRMSAHVAARAYVKRCTAEGLTALFRDLDQEQPGARDAADKSHEYRRNQDVQPCVLAEDQDYPRGQQQRRREQVAR